MNAAPPTAYTLPSATDTLAVYLRRLEGEAHPAVIASPLASDTERVLFAPSAGAQVVDLKLSPDSRHLIVATEVGGTRELRLFSTESGESVASIGAGWLSASPWRTDGSAFGFTEHRADGEAICIYTLESDSRQCRDITPGTRARVFVSGAATAVTTLQDGRWRTVLPDGSETVLYESAARHQLLGTLGGEWFIKTDEGAQNGQVLAVTPGESTRVVVGERAARLDAAALSRNRLALVYLRDAAPQIEITDLVGGSSHTVETPLGLLWTDFLRGWSGLVAGGDGSFYFRTLAPTSPGSVFRILPDRTTAMPYRGSVTDGGRPGYVTEHHLVPVDSTNIPVFITRRADLPAGPGAILLQVYSAFGLLDLPLFNAKYQAFVDAGGILVNANARGSGAYGTEWHRAGTGVRGKRRTVDDIVAVARWLHQRDIVADGRLAIEGNSAGAVPAAAAALLAPELFKAAVVEVPLADLVALSAHDEVGRWRNEFGVPEGSADIAALETYSPYALAARGTRRPAFLVTAGDQDRIAPPFHAYKLHAALSEIVSSERPSLLRVDWGTGHGADKSQAQRLAEWRAELAFLFESLAFGD